MERLLLVLFFASFQVAFGGHVVFYSVFGSKSSVNTLVPLANAMVQKGYEVTVITGWKLAFDPRIDQVLVETGFSSLNDDFSRTILSSDHSSLDLWRSGYGQLIGKALSSAQAGSLGLQRVLEEKKADVVVTNLVLLGNEISYFLAHKYNTTLALYSTWQSSVHSMHWALGSPHDPAYLPALNSLYQHPMTFFERVANTLATLGYIGFRDYYMVPQLEDLVDQLFPEDKESRPSLLQLEREAGLALQFGHPLIMDGLRPTSPNYIMLGMMNCRPGQTLPEDLQKFMDESGEDGVILVSFGSVLQASMMSVELRQSLNWAFGQLKQRVLWKWESEEMPDKPDNVRLSKWLPQQDVLAHPKLRLFITHGGQSSSQEALCHKKPMVVVPVFGDQPSNAYEAERKGLGVALPLSELTAKALLAAVNRVLKEPSFTQRAQEHGQLVMDQMNTPLERAVWWIEYAIRYPGMKHMRSPVHDLHWTQYFLIDVLAFLAFILMVILGLTCACIRCCCCRRRSSKVKRD